MAKLGGSGAFTASSNRATDANGVLPSAFSWGSRSVVITAEKGSGASRRSEKIPPLAVSLAGNSSIIEVMASGMESGFHGVRGGRRSGSPMAAGTRTNAAAARNAVFKMFLTLRVVHRGKNSLRRMPIWNATSIERFCGVKKNVSIPLANSEWHMLTLLRRGKQSLTRWDAAGRKNQLDVKCQLQTGVSRGKTNLDSNVRQGNKLIDKAGLTPQASAAVVTTFLVVLSR